MEMRVSLGQEFSQALKRLENSLHHWTADGRVKLLKAHKQIADRWRSEAVKRVPVFSSRLKQGILSNAYEQGLEIIAECGTNVTGDKGEPYPVYLEFGTKYIARGRVLALGFGPYVTDAQAIRFWPAKNTGQDVVINKKTGAKRYKDGRIDAVTGEANMKLHDAIERRLARGGADEQMPWLRSAFWKIRDWAVQHIDASIEPPRQSGSAA